MIQKLTIKNFEFSFNNRKTYDFPTILSFKVYF